MLKRIHIVPEQTIDSRLQYALRYSNHSSRYSENEIVFIDNDGFNMFYGSIFRGNISQLISFCNTIEKYFDLLC
ncbi:LOW QUALITY PROTEIN: hypothetical protein HZS_78 [Henneguya salminicola]|nr:LOW QUALITY PROTEIN: hypothetical protein HZS_78 [Henneguya salminicola]